MRQFGANVPQIHQQKSEVRSAHQLLGRRDCRPSPAVVTVSPQLGAEGSAGLHRPGEGKAGNAQLRLSGRGQRNSSCGSLFRAADRHRSGACSLYRQHGDLNGPAWRANPSFICSGGVRRPASQRGKATRSCRRCGWAADGAGQDTHRNSQGVNYRFATWYGLLAPAHTPKAILDTLYEAISSVSKDPELIAKITGLGLISQDQGPDAFETTIHNQITDLTPVLNGIAKAGSQN